jgi:hypothetical protein
MVDGRWKMEDGRWLMVDGKWKMVNGRGKKENGRWIFELIHNCMMCRSITVTQQNKTRKKMASLQL